MTGGSRLSPAVDERNFGGGEGGEGEGGVEVLTERAHIGAWYSKTCPKRPPLFANRSGPCRLVVSFRRFLKQCETYNERGDRKKISKVIRNVQNVKELKWVLFCLHEHFFACRPTFVGELTKKAVLDRHTVALRRQNRPMVREKPGRWSREAVVAIRSAVYETVRARKTCCWKEVVAIHGDRLVLLYQHTARCLVVCLPWEDSLFDALVHDAERCDRSFGNGRDSKRREQAFEYTERVLHRLMIEGKVRSALRSITERERGVLRSFWKRQTSRQPPTARVRRLKWRCSRRYKGSILSQPNLDPHCEHSYLIQSRPRRLTWTWPAPTFCQLPVRLRGGAVPGWSDSCAWQDWLLRY